MKCPFTWGNGKGFYSESGTWVVWMLKSTKHPKDGAGAEGCHLHLFFLWSFMFCPVLKATSIVLNSESMQKIHIVKDSPLSCYTMNQPETREVRHCLHPNSIFRKSFLPNNAMLEIKHQASSSRWINEIVCQWTHCSGMLHDIVPNTSDVMK